MVLCTVIYDPSSGSDTAASGCNTPATAVTGTNGDVVSAGTTLTLNGTIDFTGAANDGSDVLFLEGTTGDRHLFRISSFTGGVSTCTAIVTIEAFSSTLNAQTWAVGGKRKSTDVHVTRPDFEDGESGWDFALQDDATYVLRAGVGVPLPTGGDGTDGPIRVRCASGANVLVEQPEISAAFIGNGSSTTRVEIRGDSSTNRLTIRCTGSDSPNKQAGYFTTNSSGMTCVHVTFDGNDVGFTASVFSEMALTFVDCGFIKARVSRDGYEATGNRTNIVFIGCTFAHNAGNGYESTSASGLWSTTFVGCYFYDNGANGARCKMATTQKAHTFKNCVVDGNVQDGIEFYDTGDNAREKQIVLNCIITKNLGYGISATDSLGDLVAAIYEDWNAFWDNTSGEVNGFTQGANDITLTVDPYTDRSTYDFSLNETAGGGADCRDVALEASQN